MADVKGIKEVLNEIDSLNEYRKEARKLAIEKQSLKRQSYRSLTLCCLIAANALDQAILCGNVSNIKNSWPEAEVMADFVNKLFNKNATANDFFYRSEELANESIQHYQAYLDCIKTSTGRERLVESFSGWYARSRHESSFIRTYVYFILWVAAEISEIESGRKTYADLTAYIARLKEREDLPVNFDVRSVLKAFCSARDEVIEIENRLLQKSERTSTNEKDQEHD